MSDEIVNKVRRIREEYENGKHYYALQGTSIDLPDDPRLYPHKSALRWHNETPLKG